MTDSTKIKNKAISVDDWHRLIVSKSKCKLGNVESTLNKFGIVPQSTTPIRKAFHFHMLKFSGTKVGTKNDGDFSFKWDDLDSGLYGVLSEDNLVGKSSILRLFYSVLRGEFSGVSETVMGWINSLDTNFSVGEVHFELQLLRDESGLLATLTRTINSTIIEEYSGHLSGLSAIVDQLLMKELELERMFATKEGKSLVAHGWPVLASALFVSGSEGAVIGDLTLAGLPQRLLQLFIGLPWISTQSRASAVLKIEETSKKADQEAVTKNPILTNAIFRLKKQLADLPDSKVFEIERKNDRNRQTLLERQIDGNILRSKQSNINLGLIESEKSVLEAECLKMKRLKQSLEDDRSAGFVFRKLQPVCCPSCESTAFKFGDLNNNTGNQCPLCKEHELTEVAPDNLKIIEMQEDIDSVNDKISLLSQSHDDNSKELDLIKVSIDDNKNELEKINENLKYNVSLEESSANRLALETTINELESTPEVEELQETPFDELAILKAAVSETKKMYQEKEMELFEDASNLLKEIATTLGVKHLAYILWTSTSLRIKIANKETTYTKLSSGERLRFRIAASVTIAKLAVKTGQGRHPGVLFFDSPKSEEITDSDFQEIMSAITQLTKDDGSLQIFVASRVPKGYESKEFFKDAKHAVGIDFLF
jgi:hypothetical protein